MLSRRPRESSLRASARRFLTGRLVFRAKDRRFRRMFFDVLARVPKNIPPISSVRSVVLSKRPTKTMVGLTRYSDVKFLFLFSRPRQTITFYADLLNSLSDKAAQAVIAHELAHAWLNEHIRPEMSPGREAQADELASYWGFRAELEQLDEEAETV